MLDGTDAIHCLFEDEKGSGVLIKGTIAGQLLVDEFNKLNGKVTSLRDACYSANGQYTFWLGSGSSRAGR